MHLFVSQDCTEFRVSCTPIAQVRFTHSRCVCFLQNVERSKSGKNSETGKQSGTGNGKDGDKKTQEEREEREGNELKKEAGAKVKEGGYIHRQM